MIRNTITYLISSSDSGKRADRFLRANGFSRHLIIQIKKLSNGLLLDSTPIFCNHPLAAGQTLIVQLPQPERNEHMLPVALPLDILYEDSDIIVCNKAAGMPVHPSQGHFDDTLSNALAYYFAQKGEVFTARSVGRLDRDTSGVILFALHELSSCILAEQMRSREIHREYRAVCTGLLPESGCIDAPIARAHDSTIERIVDFSRGETAVTQYTRLQYNDTYSLAAVRLETGRTHQIRVHMKHIGHPLPGDFLYNPDYTDIARQALHSYKLSFVHPITREPMTFTAPIPADMQKLMQTQQHP